MNRKFSARSLKSLKGIHPDLRRVIKRALIDSPVDFVVIEGIRSVKRQEYLVSAGSSKTLRSRHLTGHAVDIVPIGENGKPDFAWPLYHKLGPAVKAAAKAEGVKVTWGGDWVTFKDGPHFELDWEDYPESKWSCTEKPPVRRTSPVQSKTIQLSGASVVAGSYLALAALSGTSGPQFETLAAAVVSIISGILLIRQRLLKWADGDR